MYLRVNEAHVSSVASSWFYPEMRSTRSRVFVRVRFFKNQEVKAALGTTLCSIAHDLEKGFAEATSEEKRRVSHRGRAAKRLLSWVRGKEVFG